jgi:DNA-directed RNA polymerase subunit RPC12/RpoP
LEKFIKAAPTVEAKPVVHAHWIEQEYGGYETYYTCSNCREDLFTIDGDPSDNLWSYCPYCGAQMDEVVSDTNVGSKTNEPFPQAHENGNNTQKVSVDKEDSNG